MKKLYLLSTMMLVILVAMLPQKTFAQSFYEVCSTGQCLKYSIVNSSEVSLIGGLCLTSDLEIPSTVSYNGATYSVTSIGGGAFLLCDNLTSINIPNSVTSIGGSAFEGCSSLTSINIPNSVTSIGDYAFERCSSLTSVNVPNSVTSIGYYAFRNCSGLVSINIPNSVTSIGGSAFEGCSSLVSVNIPNSVTSINFGAFSGCSNLTSIIIPNSVTSIASAAFRGCSGLSSINIPNSVTSIGDYAFEGCSSLTSITVESNNPYYDSRNNCNAIIQTNNNSLILGCQNTKIPSSVTSIGEHAFVSCSDMSSLTCMSSIPPVILACKCGVFGNVSNDFTIFIPCGSLNAYMAVWPEDFIYQEFSYDTSITIVTSDSCYVWNNEIYCTSGEYVQTFPTADGCDSIVTLHLTIETGIKSHNMTASMKVYPNPTSNIVNIELSINNGPSNNVAIQVFDIYGKLLDVVNVGNTDAMNRVPTDHSVDSYGEANAHGMSAQTTQIDLSRYANGVYFIKAVSEGIVLAVQKVVKNR